MNNLHHLKRRRPHHHVDDPSELPFPSPLPTPLACQPQQQQEVILYQAALLNANLTTPVTKLLALSQQHDQQYLLQQASDILDALIESPDSQNILHKRLRLDPDIPTPTPMPAPMPAPVWGTASVHDVVEINAPVVGTTGQQGDAHPWQASAFDHQPPSGCISCDVSHCLPGSYPNMNWFLCRPQIDQPSPPATTPCGYLDLTFPLAIRPGPLQPQGHGEPMPMPAIAGQGNILDSDDPFMSERLRDYPTMQSARVMDSQPSTAGQHMTYPQGSWIKEFLDGDTSEALDVAGSGTGVGPPAVRLAGPGSDGVTAAGFSGVDLAYTARQGSMSGLSQPQGTSRLQLSTFSKGGMGDPIAQGEQRLDVVFCHQRAPSARRGPFKDNRQRERTAHTRRIGSCIRCRMQRIRCNLDEEDATGPCLTCKKVAGNNKIWRLPCLRWKITDVRLYKPGQVKGHEWTNRWKDSVVDDIGSWASTDTRTICVTEGYTGQSVTLSVRRFQPQAGDRLERSWVSNGVKRSVAIPPYAVVDMEAAKSAFEGYIRKFVRQCCDRLFGREELLWRTYMLALKMMDDGSTDPKERELLRSTLDLWMSIRLTTKSFEIVGKDTLGMSMDLVDDAASPLHGTIPLPPVMGAQIDSLLIHQIQPSLRRKSLEELQKMTHDRKPKTWLTTYLVTFILLHNIALITKHDAAYARKHGMKTRFAREDKVREYNAGANTLLAYFHYCNKGVYPFSDECKEQDLRNLAALDDPTVEFVYDTRRYAAGHRKEWEGLLQDNVYDDEYYYISQLFERNWQHRTMV